MATPKGVRAKSIEIGEGRSVHVYSDDKRIIVQMRRDVATEKDILAPSFKVAVRLTDAQAWDLAAELGRLVLSRKPQAASDAN